MRKRSPAPQVSLERLERAYVDACVALRETQRAQEEAQRQRELEAARQLAAEAEARRQAEEQARQEAEQRAEEQARSTRRLRKWRRVVVVAAFVAVASAWVLHPSDKGRGGTRPRRTASPYSYLPPVGGASEVPAR